MSCYILVAREVTVQTPLQSWDAQWFASDIDMKQPKDTWQAFLLCCDTSFDVTVTEA